MDFDKGKKLTFKAKVEIWPSIKLKKYKGLNLKSKAVSVTKDEQESLIKRLQESHARFEPITPLRAVRKGDYTICDVSAFIDDKPITKTHENMWVQAENDTSMLGIGDKLIGANVGDTREVDTELPKDYPDKKILLMKKNTFSLILIVLFFFSQGLFYK